MAALTWQNVTAQESNNAARLLAGAGASIGNALTGAQTAIGNFGDQNTLSQMAQYNDPVQLQAAIQSGAINLGNASPDALKQILSRPQELLANAAVQQKYDQDALINPMRAKEAALRLGIADREDQKSALLAPGAIESALRSQEQSKATDAIQFPQTLVDLQRGIAEKEQARADNFTADAFVSNLRNSGAITDPLSVNKILQDVDRNSTPTFSAAVKNAFGKQFGPEVVAGSTPVLAPLATPMQEQDASLGKPGTEYGTSPDVVYGNGKYGLPDIPVSQGTIGNAVDFGEKLKKATMGKLPVGDLPEGSDVAKLGTSAQGKYQFVNSTLEPLAKRLFGPNYKDITYSEAVQDQLFDALWKETPVKNLTKVWPSLKKVDPSKYVGKSPDEVRALVVAGEAPTKAAIPSSNILSVEAQNLNSRFATALDAAGNSLVAPIEVAKTKPPINLATAVQELAPLMGKMPTTWLANNVKYVADQVGGNYNVAKEIVANALGSAIDFDIAQTENWWTGSVAKDVLDKGVQFYKNQGDAVESINNIKNNQKIISDGLTKLANEDLILQKYKADKDSGRAGGDVAYNRQLEKTRELRKQLATAMKSVKVPTPVLTAAQQREQAQASLNNSNKQFIADQNKRLGIGANKIPPPTANLNAVGTGFGSGIPRAF